MVIDMEYYSYTGNKILIGHFPGKTKYVEKDLINELKKIKFRLPNNISIISILSDKYLNSAPLNYQLNHNNIKYINYLKDKNTIYKPYNKIKYVLNSLYQSDTEYSLILDGNDVVILSDLDNIIELFKTYNKKIIYNATIWMYPHIIIDNVKNRGQYGQYCYLNAGCCIGYTKSLIDFYEYAYAILQTNRMLIDSEQYYIRKAFNDNQDKVFFDYKCKIFQCWHKQEYKIENNKCYLL